MRWGSLKSSKITKQGGWGFLYHYEPTDLNVIIFIDAKIVSPLVNENLLSLALPFFLRNCSNI